MHLKTLITDAIRMHQNGASGKCHSIGYCFLCTISPMKISFSKKLLFSNSLKIVVVQMLRLHQSCSIARKCSIFVNRWIWLLLSREDRKFSIRQFKSQSSKVSLFSKNNSGYRFNVSQTIYSRPKYKKTQVYCLICRCFCLWFKPKVDFCELLNNFRVRLIKIDNDDDDGTNATDDGHTWRVDAKIGNRLQYFIKFFCYLLLHLPTQ